MVAVAETDTSGRFSMETKEAGTFRILAFYISWQKFYSLPFTITKVGQKYDAGVIVMREESQMLKDVKVTAQKPFMEYKPDRTVYNIENSIISAGNNVFEVLKKLPGVTVDNNDNISVNNQSSVLIMIDGRTSYLSAADAATYLQSLDASQVEKIEIITSPSAKYDAAGSSIINIVMKRDKNMGLNAELTSSYAQGIYGTGTEGVNVNFASKKWYVAANYGYTFNRGARFFGNTTSFYTNSEIQNVFVDSNQREQTNWTNTGRVAIDFMPDKKQTIGFVFDGMQNNGIVDKNFLSLMDNGSMKIDSSLFMHGHRTYGSVNTAYELNYDNKIDTTGKDLSASVDYASYSSHQNEQDITTNYNILGMSSGMPIVLNYSLPTAVNVLAAKIDYEQPVGKNGTFQTGLKASYVTTDNNAQYWNVANGAESVDTAFTNDFKYSEYIYAGYVSYIKKVNKRFDFQLGLRGEETQAKGIQTVHDTTFTHNYINLFPTVLASYKLDTNNTLKLYYRRKIWRPDYQDLNPFVYVINPYSYDQGNPSLQPSISNSVSVTEVFKQVFSLEVGDEYWINPITWLSTQNNTTFVTTYTSSNFKNFNNIFERLSANPTVTKWFTSMNSLLVMQQQYIGSIEGTGFSNSALVWNFNTVNMFTLNKNWSCEIGFNYNSQSLDGENVIQPVYGLEAGVKMNFAKDRGVITLNCSDILWSNIYRGSQVFQEQNTAGYEYSDSRRIRLSLSWKLGKAQREREAKSKAAEDEMNRIK